MDVRRLGRSDSQPEPESNAPTTPRSETHAEPEAEVATSPGTDMEIESRDSTADPCGKVPR